MDGMAFRSRLLYLWSFSYNFISIAKMPKLRTKVKNTIISWSGSSAIQYERIQNTPLKATELKRLAVSGLAERYAQFSRGSPSVCGPVQKNELEQN